MSSASANTSCPSALPTQPASATTALRSLSTRPERRLPELVDLHHSQDSSDCAHRRVPSGCRGCAAGVTAPGGHRGRESHGQRSMAVSGTTAVRARKAALRGACASTTGGRRAAQWFPVAPSIRRNRLVRHRTITARTVDAGTPARRAEPARAGGARRRAIIAHSTVVPPGGLRRVRSDSTQRPDGVPTASHGQLPAGHLSRTRPEPSARARPRAAVGPPRPMHLVRSGSRSWRV